MEHKTYTCDVCGKKIDFVPEIWEWVCEQRNYIRATVSFSLVDARDVRKTAHLCWPCIREAMDKLYCKVNKRTEHWEKQGT